MQDPTEFEEAQAHFEQRLHNEDFRRHHPEYFDFKARQPATFQARVGERPTFRTSLEAVQYERGFNEHPNQPWGIFKSPRMQGFHDAEEAHAHALASMVERREPEFAVLA
jgi:hypothetical protein